MSKQTKIIIGVVAGFIVLCLAVCVVGALFLGVLGKNVAADAKPNPEKAAQTASEIADFTPLEGYQPMTGMKILGYTVVVYSKGSEADNLMMLMQMPGLTEINDTTIQQMQQAIERQSGRQARNVQVIETRELTIRDNPARVIIQETNYGESSITMRQMILAFQGKGGVAMLMLTAPSTNWDQASVDQMIDSIR